MKVTMRRREVITALRIRNGCAPVAVVMDMTRMTRRQVMGIVRRWEKYGITRWAGQEAEKEEKVGWLVLRPAGYLAVGSFPPKREVREVRTEDGKSEDQGV